MEHAINVAIGHFAQAIAPTSNSKLSSGDFEEEEEDSDMSNALGKALALITQVCKVFKLCDMALTFTIRFKSHLKPVPFSVSHVQRSTYPSSSLSTGSAPIGHHFLHALIAFLCCRRQVFPFHCLQVLIECRGSTTSSALLMTVMKYLN